MSKVRIFFLILLAMCIAISLLACASHLVDIFSHTDTITTRGIVLLCMREVSYCIGILLVPIGVVVLAEKEAFLIMGKVAKSLLLTLVSLIFIAAFFGWVNNLTDIFSSYDTMTTSETVVRCLGVILAPIGIVMGYM